MENTEIQKILPHKFPFLLIDRVLEVSENKAIGIKNVTVNEFFFMGHFPGQPIMPGVLIVEAMAQLCGILLHKKVEQGKLVFFMGIDRARFRKPVVPGDQLRLVVELKRFGGRVGSCTGKALVGDDVVAEADMMFGAAA